MEVVGHRERAGARIVHHAEHVARSAVGVREGHVGHFRAAFLDELNVEHVFVLRRRARGIQFELLERRAPVDRHEQPAFQRAFLHRTGVDEVGIRGALLHRHELRAVVERGTRGSSQRVEHRVPRAVRLKHVQARVACDDRLRVVVEDLHALVRRTVEVGPNRIRPRLRWQQVIRHTAHA